MRAMVLEQPGPAASAPLSLRERGDPQPGPVELLLDVRACAVCRTDLQLAEGDLVARRLPIVPGHQAVGRVVSMGASVTGWAVGDRAGVAWLAGSCGSCPYCAGGRENLCELASFNGWDLDGGFAERMTVDAAFAYRLPDALDDVQAAPLLCGGIIGFRSLRLSGIRPGQRLGLYGFGASALLTLQVAAYWGCEVFVVTRSQAERERAHAFGATWAGAPGDDPPVALDAAVTFAPVGEVVIAALRALAPGGTVAVNAIHLDRVPQFDYDLLWRERAIRSVANFTRADARDFLELASLIPLQTIVEPHPLGDANEVLVRLASGDIGGAAVLVP